MNKLMAILLVMALLVPMAAMAEGAVELADAMETIEGGDAPIAGLANPFVTCTADEAFAQLDQNFVITAPDGFYLEEIAKLSVEQLGAGNPPTARIVFVNEGGMMYRVMITAELSDLAADGEFVAVDVEGQQAFYNEQASSVSFALDGYEVSIDVADATKDELVSYVANVRIATEEDLAALVPGIEPEDIEGALE